MNELKAGVLVTPHNEGMCFHRSSAVIAVTEGETEFYLKSEADKVIAELKEERRWRKCSEEKPPHSGIYLVCIAGHVRTLDTFDSDRNLWRNYNSTHWMPLPSAPKEENK